jgi:uncharacterized membrane protein
MMDDNLTSLNGFQPAEPRTEEATGLGHDRRSPMGMPAIVIGAGLALYGLTRRSFRGTAVAALGAGLAATGARSRQASSAHETMVRRVLTINKPRHEVYEQWRRLEELPRSMNNLQSVEKTDDRHSHWSAKGPLGLTVEWDAETTHQEPDTVISWQSLPDAPVPNHGTVRFSDAPNGRGTQFDLTMFCRLPAGMLGSMIARLSGRHPQAQVESDLRRFKALLEAGEVPTTRDQPTGERSAIGKFAGSWAGAR